VDEQKQIILIAAPVMTQERYSQLTGLTEGAGKGPDRKRPPAVSEGGPCAHSEHLTGQV